MMQPGKSPRHMRRHVANRYLGASSQEPVFPQWNMRETQSSKRRSGCAKTDQ